MKNASTFLKSLFAQLSTLLIYSVAYAQVEGYRYTTVTSQGHLYKLATGGFGSFIMIFSGLGGVATVMLTRRGKTRQGVPLAGVGMLVLAASLFAFRIAIKGGILGHEYLEW